MEYLIERAISEVPLVGEVEGTPWSRADVATIDRFPWDTGKTRETASARALYDEDALYLQYQVEDKRIVADTTSLNGPVYEDSAVEYFASPDPADRRYFNFEVNCVGTVHLGWGPDRTRREHVNPETADAIRVATSVDGPVTEPDPDDQTWWLAATLPFKALSRFTGTEISPGPGTTWKGNFQRLGGGSEFAVWSTIEAPEPDFHRPEAFGGFEFAMRSQ